METVAYTAFRKDLRGWLNRTRDDAEPIMVTSKDPSSNVIVMNAHDYDNLMETFRIYTNPYLMDKLNRGIAQVKAGQARPHGLMEDDDE